MKYTVGPQLTQNSQNPYIYFHDVIYIYLFIFIFKILLLNIFDQNGQLRCK